MKSALEKAVADTSLAACEWVANRAKIEAQISDADARRAKASELRQRHALNASLGDPHAISEIAKARSDSATAEGDLRDLQQAMIAAGVRLVEAENEAKIARSHLARFEVEILQRERIDVAGEIDKAIAQLAALCSRYEKLGREIINMPDAMAVLPNMHGISNFDGAMGARRLRAALPAFVQTLYPGSNHDEQKKEPLAMSEARFWNLPPEQPEKKAA